MQEITLLVWGWGSKGIELRAYILLQFWKFIIFVYWVVYVQMKLRRMGLCSECLFIFVHFYVGIM